jgi:hypothetical protein
MAPTILDVVDALDKREFLSYLERLEGKLHEAWTDDVKDAVDAVRLLINIVDSADSATWRYVAKDFIVRAMRAGRMKAIMQELGYD